jgi:hypothetical protein
MTSTEVREDRGRDCPCDGELMPRWRGPDEMVDDAQAMGFVCHRCGREYLPYQVANRRLKGLAG